MSREFTFGLGCSALSQLRHYKGPAFITIATYRKRVSNPVLGPLVDWVGMDSGGYTALKNTGAWPWGVRAHARQARRAMAWLGPKLPWVAVQDWMCSPEVLARTGLTPATHIRRTCQSWADLLHAAPDVPWAPVLQGVTKADYLRCADEAEHTTGRKLKDAPAVLIGSIAARCMRRDGTAERWIVDLAAELVDRGMKIHPLGGKRAALREFARVGCVSSDSQGWSAEGRSGKKTLAGWLGLPNPKYPPKPDKLLALAIAAENSPPVGSVAARSLLSLQIAGGKCPANSTACAEAWRIEQNRYVVQGLALRAQERLACAT